MDLEDAEKSLLEVTAGRENLGDWITAQVEGRPYIVAFPGSGKKVNLVHNAWSKGSQLVSFLAAPERRPFLPGRRIDGGQDVSQNR